LRCLLASKCLYTRALTLKNVPQPLLQVDIGSDAEIQYNASGYDAHDMSAAPAGCGRAVTLKCRDGLAPESRIGSNVNCSDVTFEMTCNEEGYWQGFQKCVPKMCVVNETLQSSLVAVGATHTRDCPVGYEIAQVEKAALCQDNCLMNSVQTCQPFHCLYPNGSDRGVQGPAGRALYGGNISVRCSQDYITFDGRATCNQQFVATCQADATFDHRDMCVRAWCDPYVSVDPNISADPWTTRTTLAGTTIRVQCKKHYARGMGWGFNLSDLPASQYAVRGQELAQSVACGKAVGCQWDSQKECEEVPCKCMRYFDFLKGQPPRTDGKLAPILHPSQSDGLFASGQDRLLACPPGYQLEDTGGNTSAHVLCSDTCTLLISRMCVPVVCTWRASAFLALEGVAEVP